MVPGCTCLLPHEGDALGGTVQLSERLLERPLPSVFSSTKFIRRRLTPKEWLSCFDCPAHVLKQVPASKLLALGENIQVPFKILFHVVRSVADFLDSSVEDPL